MDIATLTSDHFAPLIGDSVTVDTPQGPLMLKVEKITAAEVTPEGLRQPFTVTLTGPRSPRLNQGAWPVALPGLGETALFLSPFAQTEDETRYEVIFG